MSFLQRSGEWYAFDTKKHRYCRRVTLFDEMEWGIDVGFEDCLDISLAPLGGPVAIVDKYNTSTVVLYNNAGRKMREAHLPSDAGNIIKTGWSKEEHLCVFTTKFQCVIFELGTIGSGGGPTHQLKLAPQSTAASSIVEFRPGGLITIDTNGMMRAVAIEEKKAPEVIEVDLSSELNDSPSAIDVLPKEITEDMETLVYVAPGKNDDNFGSIFCVSLGDSSIQDLDLDIESGVANLKVGHDGTEIALYTYDGRLMVISSEFGETKFCFRVGATVPPLSMHWCGADFFYLTFSKAQMDEMEDPSHFSLLVPILPNMESKYELIYWDSEGSGLTAAVAETDGIRIITEIGCYFLENLPPCLTHLFQLKSTSNTAQVADAYQDFLSDNVRGIVTMRKLATTKSIDFTDTVDELVDAACSEFELEQQELILAVASFAKSFCAHYDADRYVESMKRIRVLNAIRVASCAITMSLRQYQTLSGSDQLRHLSPSEAQVLVDRLVNRQEFQLAYDIAKLVKMRVEKVLVRWSCTKVQQSQLSDSEIRAVISKVLNQCPGASFTDAALTAYRAGREQLAIKLLHDEPRSQNKVMLFMQMGQDELALRMALESSNPDLVHLVLVRLLDKLSPQGVVNMFMRLPEAQTLLSHASTVYPKFRTPVKMLYEDSHCTHLTAVSKLEELMKGQDSYFLEALCDKERAPNPDDDDFQELPEEPSAKAEGEGENEAEGEGSPTDTEKKKSLWSKFKKKSIADVALEAAQKRREEKAAEAERLAREKPNVEACIAALEDCETVTLTLPKKCPLQGTRNIDGSDLITIQQLFADSTKVGADASARSCKLHSDLLQDQEKFLEISRDNRFLNASIVQTIRLCFQNGMEKQADQIRVKYNVTDKKYWFVKLVALCEASNWDGVDKLGGSGKYSKVKSPIGFLPFIETLARYSREDQAASFVSRLPDLYDRVEWYCKLDNFQKAIDDAYKDENIDLIEQIRKKAQNPTIIEYATKRIRSLE